MQTFIINTELSDGVSSDERTVSGSSGAVLGGVGPEDAGREGQSSGGTAGDTEKAENYDLEGNSRHYQTPGIECVDAIKAATQGRDGYEGYLVGQCIKYLWRYGRKSDVGRGLDLKKCLWYAKRLSEHVEQTP